VLGGVILGFLLAAGLPLGSQVRSASEYELKAAFLFNFAKFVDWPTGTFADPDDPFRVCVWGSDSFAAVVEQVVRGKKVKEHPFRVETVHKPDQTKGCQILFISAIENRPPEQLLQGSDGLGILTVGEREDFAREGGMINFVMQQNRLGLEINPDAADRQGVKISAKLLSLARIVGDRSRAEQN
jgi:YfiR/HmsC-like